MNTTKTTPAASASQHTPEPWYYESDGEGSALNHRDKYVCADNAAGRVLTLNTPTFAASEQEIRANGRRIVACVNACAGMADPAADIAALRAALRFLLEEINPDIGLESAVSQELYDDRRPRRAALLSQLRAARAALANKGANHA